MVGCDRWGIVLELKAVEKEKDSLKQQHDFPRLLLLGIGIVHPNMTLIVFVVVHQKVRILM